MKRSVLKLCVIACVSLFLTSCASFFYMQGRHGVSGSLVDYIYPDGEVPDQFEETTPNLRLPLRVGLAFVPSQHGGSYLIPEAQKTQLLDEVKSKFKELNYVKEIVVIPETYMKRSKGFTGMEQIARLFSLDIMALVSYDQVLIAEDNPGSILYWTIVGSYLIPGNENTATTFVDTAVFDVSSRKLLLRAPGVSETQRLSTLIGLEENARKAKEEGFQLAMQDMSNNLEGELVRFQERIKEDKSVEISYREGYGGGGAIPWMAVLFLMSGAAFRYVRNSRKAT